MLRKRKSVVITRKDKPRASTSRAFASTAFGDELIEESKQKTTRKKEIKFVPLVSDQRCEQMRENLLSSSDFASYSDDDLRILSFHLHQLITISLSNKRFDEAEAYEGLQVRVKQENARRKAATVPRLDLQRQVIENSRNLEIEHKRAIQALDAEHQRALNELLEAHQKELELFESRWKQNKPRQYRKPTAEILNMRYQERSMILTKNISQIKPLEKVLKAKVRDIVDHSLDSLLADYTAAKTSLLARQRAEVITFQNKKLDEKNVIITQQRNTARQKEAEIAWSQKKYTTPKIEEPAPLYSAIQPKYEYDYLLPQIQPPKGTWEEVQMKRRREKANHKAKEIPDRPPSAYQSSIKGNEAVFKTQSNGRSYSSMINTARSYQENQSKKESFLKKPEVNTKQKKKNTPGDTQKVMNTTEINFSTETEGSKSQLNDNDSTQLECNSSKETNDALDSSPNSDDINNNKPPQITDDKSPQNVEEESTQNIDEKSPQITDDKSPQNIEENSTQNIDEKSPQKTDDALSHNSDDSYIVCIENSNIQIADDKSIQNSDDGKSKNGNNSIIVGRKDKDPPDEQTAEEESLLSKPAKKLEINQSQEDIDDTLSYSTDVSINAQKESSIPKETLELKDLFDNELKLKLSPNQKEDPFDKKSKETSNKGSDPTSSKDTTENYTNNISEVALKESQEIIKALENSSNNDEDTNNIFNENEESKTEIMDKEENQTEALDLSAEIIGHLRDNNEKEPDFNDFENYEPSQQQTLEQSNVIGKEDCLNADENEDFEDTLKKESTTETQNEDFEEISLPQDIQQVSSSKANNQDNSTFSTNENDDEEKDLNDFISSEVDGNSTTQEMQSTDDNLLPNSSKIAGTNNVGENEEKYLIDSPSETQHFPLIKAKATDRISDDSLTKYESDATSSLAAYASELACSSATYRSNIARSTRNISLMPQNHFEKQIAATVRINVQSDDSLSKFESDVASTNVRIQQRIMRHIPSHFDLTPNTSSQDIDNLIPTDLKTDEIDQSMQAKNDNTAPNSSSKEIDTSTSNLHEFESD